MSKKHRKQVHRGRVTAPVSLTDPLNAEVQPDDPHGLRQAAHRAVDEIPRTPIARLNRQIKKNPALKELSATLKEAMKEANDDRPS